MAFLYSHWMALPLSTRQKIAAAFGIAKTGATHVSNDVVVDDGYKIGDVERALNTDAIEKYLGINSTGDMNELWAAMINKAEGREPIVAINEGNSENVETITAEGGSGSSSPIIVTSNAGYGSGGSGTITLPKKRGRPAKKK